MTQEELKEYKRLCELNIAIREAIQGLLDEANSDTFSGNVWQNIHNLVENELELETYNI